MRQRQEHHVEAGEVGGIERSELQAAIGGRQRREELPDAAPGVGVGRDVHGIDLGVPGEQPQQLGPRVP